MKPMYAVFCKRRGYLCGTTPVGEPCFTKHMGDALLFESPAANTAAKSAGATVVAIEFRSGPLVGIHRYRLDR
jgi:hypothetical protein